MQTPPNKMISVNLLVPFLIAALVFGILIWQKYRASRELPPEPHIQQPTGGRTAVLFFVADDTHLAREAREMEACSDITSCVRNTLDELFNGPVGELDEVIPEGALLDRVQVEGSLATVHLNSAFGDELPSGSSSEMLAVYSIVNTVCVNFPQITRVKLIVVNAANGTLGQMDLSEPLLPDYSPDIINDPPAPAANIAPSKTEIRKKKP